MEYGNNIKSLRHWAAHNEIEYGFFRGRVPNFNQSDTRKQCFLASDWLKFGTLPRKYHTLFHCEMPNVSEI